MTVSVKLANLLAKFTPRLNKSSKLALFIVFVGFFGAMLDLTSAGLFLEEEWGLSALFLLRGPTIPASDDVVIISVDQISVETLHLNPRPTKWPRSYYARLLDKVNSGQPALVGLNVLFEEKNPDEDMQLAAEIKKNRNVVLSNYIYHQTLAMPGFNEEVSSETLVESAEVISAAALASAPFLIPKSSSTIKKYWTHKESAGDLKTFPDLLFQLYVIKQTYPLIKHSLKTLNPALADTLPEQFGDLATQDRLLDTLAAITQTFRQHFLFDRQRQVWLAEQTASATSQRLLKAWLALLSNRNSLYLNHYGKTGTLKTVSFHQALNMDASTLKDKIVLVGFADSIEPERNLGFYTVYTTDIASPIEIAATAVNNLLDSTWIKPLMATSQTLLLLLWGSGLALLGLTRPYRQALGLLAILASGYLLWALLQFISDQTWLPLVIPLGLQLPIVLVAASIRQYRHTDRANLKMQWVLGNMLPKEVVDNLPHQPGHIMDTSGQRQLGVCMATDICDYTQLAETLDARALIESMNAYYALIFPLVNEHGGYVTDLAGDGMYAVWPNPKGSEQQRQNACRAALDIKNKLAAFNQGREHPLFTRFGLAYGEFSIGHTGAPGRYIYRAIGDPVNTASRVENLNKQLGTHILLARTMADGLSEFVLRDLGLFRLKGKTHPVPIMELLMFQQDLNANTAQLLADFNSALQLYQRHQFAEALAQFLCLAETYPDDGPTQFFIRYIETVQSANHGVSGEKVPCIDLSLFGF